MCLPDETVGAGMCYFACNTSVTRCSVEVVCISLQMCSYFTLTVLNVGGVSAVARHVDVVSLM